MTDMEPGSRWRRPGTVSTISRSDGEVPHHGQRQPAFAIRNGEAQEHAAPEKMTVLVVGAHEGALCEGRSTPASIRPYKAEVGGDIPPCIPSGTRWGWSATMKGKLIGLEMKTGACGMKWGAYDIMAGTFLVVGLGEEDLRLPWPRNRCRSTRNTSGSRNSLSTRGDHSHADEPEKETLCAPRK